MYVPIFPVITDPEKWYTNLTHGWNIVMFPVCMSEESRWFCVVCLGSDLYGASVEHW